MKDPAIAGTLIRPDGRHVIVRRKEGETAAAAVKRVQKNHKGSKRLNGKTSRY